MRPEGRASGSVSFAYAVLQVALVEILAVWPQMTGFDEELLPLPISHHLVVLDISNRYKRHGGSPGFTFKRVIQGSFNT